MESKHVTKSNIYSKPRIIAWSVVIACLSITLITTYVEGQQSAAYMRQNDPVALKPLKLAHFHPPDAYALTPQSDTYDPEGSLVSDPNTHCMAYNTGDGGWKELCATSNDELDGGLWERVTGLDHNYLRPRPGPTTWVNSGNSSPDAIYPITAYGQWDGGTNDATQDLKGTVYSNAVISPARSGNTAIADPVPNGTFETTGSVVTGYTVYSPASWTFFPGNLSQNFLVAGGGYKSTYIAQTNSNCGDDPHHPNSGHWVRYGYGNDLGCEDPLVRLYASGASATYSYMTSSSIDLTGATTIKFWEKFIRAGKAMQYTKSIVLDYGQPYAQTIWSVATGAADIADHQVTVTISNTLVGTHTITFLIQQSDDFFLPDGTASWRQGQLACRGSDDISYSGCTGLPGGVTFAYWECTPCISNCSGTSSSVLQCIPQSIDNGSFECTSTTAGSGGQPACWAPPDWNIDDVTITGSLNKSANINVSAVYGVTSIVNPGTGQQADETGQVAGGTFIGQQRGTGSIAGNGVLIGSSNTAKVNATTSSNSTRRMHGSEGTATIAYGAGPVWQAQGLVGYINSQANNSDPTPDGGVQHNQVAESIASTAVIGRPTDTYNGLHVYAPTISGGTIGNLNGFYMDDLTGLGTNVYGLYIAHIGNNYIAGLLQVHDSLRFDSTLSVNGSTGSSAYTLHGGSTPAWGISTVPGGGTGAISLTNHAVLLGQGTSPIIATSVGATNTVLHGNSTADPSFSAVDLANDVTGNLGVSHLNSGTSASSSTCWYGDASWKTCGTGGAISGLTANGAIYATSSTALTSTGAMTDGQLLIGKTGGVPTATTLTAGTGITITNAANSIIITASGGGSGTVTTTGSPADTYMAYFTTSSAIQGDANFVFDYTNVRAYIGGSNSSTAKMTLSAAGGSDGQLYVYDTSSFATGVGGTITLAGNANTISAFAQLQGFKENATSGNYASGFRIYTRANGGSLTEQMRISSTGAVGIGTNAPGAILHVKTSASGATTFFESTTTATNGYTEFGLVNDLGTASRSSVYMTDHEFTDATKGADSLVLETATSAGNIVFSTNNTPRVFIKADGSLVRPGGSSDNGIDLGTSSNEWKRLYVGTSVIVNAHTTLGDNSLLFTSATTLDANGTLSVNATNNGAITFGSGTFTMAGKSLLSGVRLEEAQGASVASANTLTLGTDGNYYKITGTTTLKGITTANWQAGSRITLDFTGAPGPTVNNNDGSPGAGAVALILAGGANMTTTARTLLTLRYDGTNWVEMGRNSGNGILSGLSANGAVYATSSSAITSTAAMTNGQLLIGQTSGTPAAATITAGTNVTITNGANSITIAATGGSGINSGITDPPMLTLPGSGMTFSDEFTGFSGWTLVGQTPVSGSVDPTHAFTSGTSNGVYDTTTRAGWLLIQPGTAVGTTVTQITRTDVTLPTNCTIVARVGTMINITHASTDDASILLALDDQTLSSTNNVFNTSASTHGLAIGTRSLIASSMGKGYWFLINNNGSNSNIGTESTSVSFRRELRSTVVIALIKKNTTYYGYIGDGTEWIYLGSTTTITQTMSRLKIEITSVQANASDPNAIFSVDFVRVYDGTSAPNNVVWF